MRLNWLSSARNAQGGPVLLSNGIDGNGVPNLVHRHHNPIWAGLANDALTAMLIVPLNSKIPFAVVSIVQKNQATIIDRLRVLYILFTELQIFLGSLLEKRNQVVSILFFKKTDIHLLAIFQDGQFMVTGMIKHGDSPNSLSIRAQLTVAR